MCAEACAENRLLVERFLAPFACVSFDSRCSVEYARIRTHLELGGQKIGPNDLMIAATALANGATLVTMNTREFKRVPGLTLECWDEVEI